MPHRTDAPRDEVRRLTSHRFPSRARRRHESATAFAWLAADPVFEGVVALDG